MIFYEINQELVEITPEEITPDKLIMGCVTPEELLRYGKQFGFDDETIEASQKANPLFRTGADVHGAYTFTELRVVNPDGHEDFLSLYVKHNFLLIVDIEDDDNSTTTTFLKALKKYSTNRINEERMVFCFIDSLLSDGNRVSETIRNRLTEMEESIVTGDAGESFNIELLEEKKLILKYYNFYEQILDVTETLEENENDIFEEDALIYISNLSNKVTRLRDDMNSLNSISDHIQDAYTGLLDQRLNNTMKKFTIITTIFFPLTIIVGWYGMNFQGMPELSWQYGYRYVTVLSLCVVVTLIIVGKIRKWF